jgi:hypothetical protein
MPVEPLEKKRLVVVAGGVVPANSIPQHIGHDIAPGQVTGGRSALISSPITASFELKKHHHKPEPRMDGIKKRKPVCRRRRVLSNLEKMERDLKDPEVYVRELAIHGLAYAVERGCNATKRKISDMLCKSLKDSDDTIRRKVALVLSRIADRSAVKFLERAAKKETDDTIKDAMCIAIGHCRAQHPNRSIDPRSVGISMNGHKPGYAPESE